MTDVVAMLERLAAEPKPFYVVFVWRHEDGSLERKDRNFPQPRREMAEQAAFWARRDLGKVQTTPAGTKVTLEAVEVEERR